jgi:hypothetical protein
MSTLSARVQTITFTGDVTATQTNAALQNPASPAVNQLQSLALGANTITVPAGGATPAAVTIIPPAGNVTSITLKGVAGDTGIGLHLTDPTTIALAAGVTSFVLNAGNTITGVRFIWT